MRAEGKERYFKTRLNSLTKWIPSTSLAAIPPAGGGTGNEFSVDGGCEFGEGDESFGVSLAEETGEGFFTVACRIE